MGPWFPVVDRCSQVLQASAHYRAHPSLLCLELNMFRVHTGLFSAEQDEASFEGRARRLNPQMGLPLGHHEWSKSAE